MSQRVVVTGLGVISPIGNSVQDFWEGLMTGRSGAAPITSFDTSDFKNKIGCEVKDFDPAQWVGSRAGDYGRASQMAIAAGRMALDDSGLDLEARAGENMGVSMGTTNGESQTIEKAVLSWYKTGTANFNEGFIFQCSSNIISTNIADELGLLGPNIMIPTACAAGNYAIGYAFDTIQKGVTDAMLAGGAEAFSRIAFTGFSRVHGMSPDVCRPFDKNRKGLLLGEGAGIVLLESFESAQKRGAKIYVEVLGYGLSSDAYHITAPHPEGDGAARVMARALDRAGLCPSDVDYINAHGTGTGHNDKAETLAIKKVFGERAYRIPVSSIKALTGHGMGSASAIEAIACILSIDKRMVPPT
ncbi:MAG: beta-ketoacyl-[acyl-carrier-protein] synthase family protein [bacterium]